MPAYFGRIQGINMRCITCHRTLLGYSLDHATVKLALQAVKALPVATVQTVADELGMMHSSMRQVFQWLHRHGHIRLTGQIVNPQQGARRQRVWAISDGTPDAALSFGESRSARQRRRAAANRLAADGQKQISRA